MLWVFHSCFNVNNNLKIPFDQSATYLTLFYKALCQIKIAAFQKSAIQQSSFMLNVWLETQWRILEKDKYIFLRKL